MLLRKTVAALVLPMLLAVACSDSAGPTQRTLDGTWAFTWTVLDTTGTENGGISCSRTNVQATILYPEGLDGGSHGYYGGGVATCSRDGESLGEEPITEVDGIFVDEFDAGTGEVALYFATPTYWYFAGAMNESGTAMSGAMEWWYNDWENPPATSIGYGTWTATRIGD